MVLIFMMTGPWSLDCLYWWSCVCVRTVKMDPAFKLWYVWPSCSFYGSPSLISVAFLFSHLQGPSGPSALHMLIDCPSSFFMPDICAFAYRIFRIERTLTVALVLWVESPNSEDLGFFLVMVSPLSYPQVSLPYACPFVWSLASHIDYLLLP